MLIYILDADFKKIDLLRDYDFAQYTDYARDIGTFQINARVVERNLFLLDKTKQFYLLFDDRIVAEITNVSKDSDSQYEKTMIIVGKFVINVFNYRIIYGTFSYKGYSYEYIRDLIYSQTRDVNIKRKLNIDVYTGSESDEVELKEVCSVVDKQVTGGYLWDEIKEAADSDSLVFNLKPKGTDLIASTENGIDSWMFSISCGVDRTKGNKKGNIPVVFSQSLSNIERTAYTIDSSLYKNVAYVAGEGEGEDRKWYEIDVSDPKQNIDESSNKGWKRKELWVDARDIQTVDSEGTEIPEEEYTNLIVERSKEKFKDNDLSEQYTSTIIAANKQYEYGKDYNKGDWVTVEDEELGIRVDAQVTSVTKSVQGDHEIVDVEFTYGKIRDRNKVINNSVVKVEQISVDVKYLENRINNIINVVNVPITLNLDNCSDYLGGVYYYPELKLCVCGVRVTRKFTASGSDMKEYEMFRIPEEYVQNVAKALSVYAMVSNSAASLYSAINTNGTVVLRMIDTTNPTYFYFEGCWMVE